MRAAHGLRAAALRLALAAALIAGPALPAPAAATGVDSSAASERNPDAGRLSSEASSTLAWIRESGDNLDLPFLIIDKARARVSAFDAAGTFQSSSAALIGLGRGDISPAGIGQRRLADIAPSERITPAGRFISALGNDLGEADVLWVDYDNAISLHRVIAGNRKDRRHQRLASASADDNRISYGCINVPVEFFEKVVLKLFNRTNGIVYILPESMPANAFFAIPAPDVNSRPAAVSTVRPAAKAGGR